MDLRLLSKLLGIVSVLIGATMLFSLPWALPGIGHRTNEEAPHVVEWSGLLALLASMIVCFVVGGVLMLVGRGRQGRLFRKEAMAVVGLSWIWATVLGALPFYFGGVRYVSPVRLFGVNQPVLLYDARATNRGRWSVKPQLSIQEYAAISALAEAGSGGLSESELSAQSGQSNPENLLRNIAGTDDGWASVIVIPDQQSADERERFRLPWVRMGIADCLFESQSGFSTTGATILSDLEDPELVPHCILFWRSSTHFLGGLGIIVLFVVILGQGSAGKALMRAEMPGPTKESATARMQHTAWLFGGIYCVLNLVLTVILLMCDVTLFDALCHAFGTLATGGFSTFNESVGAFDSSAIDYTITAFMFLAGTNFTLLFVLFVMRQPGKLSADIEWRTYMALILLVTIAIVVLGMFAGDFADLEHAIRYALFQVVAIITTTGYGTADFDGWNSFARGVLLILMFVGGCAGSTGGGMKVIRHIMFVKILRLEVEQSFHPRVVRPLRVGGNPVDDPDLRKNILVYFALILIIFVFSWLFVVTTEPRETWGVTSESHSHKLIDSASAVAATLNNIGPGLGNVGSTKNYAYFSPLNKLLFVWLMMIGRLEIFAILVLFMPRFWRDR